MTVEQTTDLEDLVSETEAALGRGAPLGDETHEHALVDRPHSEADLSLGVLAEGHLSNAVVHLGPGKRRTLGAEGGDHRRRPGADDERHLTLGGNGKVLKRFESVQTCHDAYRLRHSQREVLGHIESEKRQILKAQDDFGMTQRGKNPRLPDRFLRKL